MRRHWTLALLLTACACSQRPVILGSQPGVAGAVAASANVQSWWLLKGSALPSLRGDGLNQRLASMVQNGLPMPCSDHAVMLDRSQRALLDHIAALLRQSPGTSLAGLGVGPVTGLPEGCRQLWALTGRLGGGKPGWLALGVVDLPAGTISSMTIGRWAAADSLTAAQIAALAEQLMERLREGRL